MTIKNFNLDNVFVLRSINPLVPDIHWKVKHT